VGRKYQVISGDGHLETPPNFVKFVPEKWKDRAPRLIRPLVRHGRVVSLIGGLLVAAIGVAMIFDWLSYLPRFFNFGGV